MWTEAMFGKDVYVLPKHLDEKVALLQLDKQGVKLTTLSDKQDAYFGVFSCWLHPAMKRGRSIGSDPSSIQSA